MQLNDALAHRIVSLAIKILWFPVDVNEGEQGPIIASDEIRRSHAIK